jgi:hypothetical protein
VSDGDLKMDVVEMSPSLGVGVSSRPLKRMRLVGEPPPVEQSRVGLVLDHPVPPDHVVDAQAVPVALDVVLDAVAELLLDAICPGAERRYPRIDAPRLPGAPVARIRRAPDVKVALYLLGYPTGVRVPIPCCSRRWWHRHDPLLLSVLLRPAENFLLRRVR